MEKSQWLGPALFSIVAGLLGVMLIPFQQSCPPEPLGVQCSGYVTPAIDLALLYASVAAIIGGIATLGLLTFQRARAKNWEGILRTLSRSLTFKRNVRHPPFL